ncbi:hypothetical protein L6Q21_00270 [Sandaracinobacter sp. RS1-74]|uniref:hypothetical protein n=1 Tax=Sandaracinobacteroides sayramensis TaxID=2913411 RepID=UPI001EDAACFC|nr:hypothetical protein [Sandaracinobacteroides sayramensis]MCG2839411.1 hypothetical protein [Sandaracinobacteroides sayramensis]
MIEEPGAGTDMRLPPEQQQSLKADLAREGKALADAQAEVARNKAALDKALANAKGKPRGSEPWSDAQMALSRFDLARAPFGEIEARMTPLLRMVDSLDSEDPDRQTVENLATAATRASADAERRVQTAGAALAL